MAKAKVGDRVRFLNAVGGGVVARVDGSMIYVEDEDGFLTPAFDKECVVVADAKTEQAVAATENDRHPAPRQTAPSVTDEMPTRVAMTVVAPEEKFHETPEGEKLNMTLAFEPLDTRQLSSTTWDVVLVNDSNYYLSVSLMCRSAGDETWTFLRATSVEPATQVRLVELDSADIPALDFIAVQYIAYKTDRSFSMKQPASVELKIDTTKFFKLHCYKDNPYFDNDVIAHEIVQDDTPAGKKKIDVNAANLRRSMLASKKAADMRPERKPLMKRQRHRDPDPSKELVVDLHIAELVDNVRGLSPADMLNRQIDEFREVMDANLRNKGRKIIFIHGKGEGVLRSALLKELNHRYKGHDVQDASFREYGFGATQVIIR